MRHARHRLVLRVVLIGLLAVPAFAGRADTPADIAAAHAAWRDALLAGDGAAAWDRVDLRTRAFFADVLRQAWDADRQALSQLPVTAMVLVLQARTYLARDELLALDGEGLFYHAARNGWLDSGLLQGQTVEDIRVDGATATATQRIGEQVYPLPLGFSSENGVWRVDMTSSMAQMHAAFLRQARQSGMTPLELVLQLLQAQSGEAVPAEAMRPARRM